MALVVGGRSLWGRSLRGYRGFNSFRRIARASRLQRASKLERASSSMQKPGWHVGKGKRWGPEIPDQQYFWDHPSYNGLVLWLRGIRPYLEKIATDVWKTGAGVVLAGVTPLQRLFISHNPDVRLIVVNYTSLQQLVAFFSFYATAQSINIWLNKYYQRLMDLSYLQSLEAAQRLEQQHFFESESEDLSRRVHNYSADHKRLNELWNKALSLAAEEKEPEAGFLKLCESVSSDDDDDLTRSPSQLPLPITWRFNMIPYGNEDAQAFDVPPHEQPHRALALNFTYNNLAYDWGDYVERRDNKLPLMRPRRQMFTDVYIPPTK